MSGTEEADAATPLVVETLVVPSRRIAATIFSSRATPIERVVVIAPATATPQVFYAEFAAYLTEQATATVTFDYTGVAKSERAPLQSSRAGMSDWAHDLEAVTLYARTRFPEVPVIMLGHSLGGVLSLVACGPARASRVVTVGAQTAYFMDWPWKVRFARLLRWHVLHVVATVAAGYLPGVRLELGVNLPARFSYEWASLCLSPNWWKKIIPHFERLAECPCPVSVMEITDDTIGTSKAVHRLHSVLPQSRVTHFKVEPSSFGLHEIGHFGLFRSKAAATWPTVVRLLGE